MVNNKCHKIVTDLLDLILGKHNLTSDYQLAKHLNVSLPTIRNYRLGKTKPNATMCVVIANELREDPLRVIAKIKLEGDSTPKEREVWRRYAGRVFLVPFIFAGFQISEKCAEIGQSLLPVYTLCAQGSVELSLDGFPLISCQSSL